MFDFYINKELDSKMQDALKKIQYKTFDCMIVDIKGHTITKDNIHLYYEFMSDDDLSKYSNMLLATITKRISIVLDNLELTKNDAGNFEDMELHGHFEGKFQKLDSTYGTIPLKYFTFGVKDTLKPIDEYIAEIKDSNTYKEYIASNTKIKLDIVDIKNGCDYDFCTYIVYDDGIEVKRFEDIAYTQKAFVNFHNKIFSEFGAYRVNRSLLQGMSDYDYKKCEAYKSYIVSK